MTKSPSAKRERWDDFFCHAIAKILLLRIGAQILKWQGTAIEGLSGSASVCADVAAGSLALSGICGDVPAVCPVLTSPTKRKPLRETVRMRRCSSPLSQIALRAALM
jgi:hypothetical protein